MTSHRHGYCCGTPSIAGAGWLTRRDTLAVLDALHDDGVETRVVGGAVRDTLLGLPVTQPVDLATTAEPEKVMALAKGAGLKAVPTGIDHGTVTVIADGAPFEVTTLRRDVETYGRHAKVAYGTSWEEDARRRDFTLNALYADRNGKVFDPLGGYEDLRGGRVRFIGDAEARIKEDYLRILRFFRFNAYYGKGKMDEAGLKASVRLCAGLDQLSAERIAGELRRILAAPGAAGAVEALFDHGLLTRVLGGVPQLGRFERLVAIEMANGLAPNPGLRLAALAVFVSEDVTRLAACLRLSNAEQAVLALGIRDDGLAGLPEEEAAKVALYRLGASYRPALLIAWADSGAPPDDAGWRRALTLPERWQTPSLPISGSDIAALGVLKGPEIGAVLKAVEQHWIDTGFALDRDRLLAKARELVAARPEAS
ncbi:MAG TPA: CCA tRNA nucleotidyltransferase [Methyloceanibacter sp.]|nr:CCA tRNA nucleotidyltransferase [Methyloceanibacter sp.]